MAAGSTGACSAGADDTTKWPMCAASIHLSAARSCLALASDLIAVPSRVARLPSAFGVACVDGGNVVVVSSDRDGDLDDPVSDTAGTVDTRRAPSLDAAREAALAVGAATVVALAAPGLPAAGPAAKATPAPAPSSISMLTGLKRPDASRSADTCGVELAASWWPAANPSCVPPPAGAEPDVSVWPPAAPTAAWIGEGGCCGCGCSCCCDICRVSCSCCCSCRCGCCCDDCDD
mmetsp:Transcript_81248/g.226189  ORF Transcript_81248/g.226189 Transcript_81248/m.226189 type:complete len:233 (+) Transcript_81248:696-1394(+)